MGELSGVKASTERPCTGVWSDSGTVDLTLEGVTKHTALSWIEGVIDLGKRKGRDRCIPRDYNPFFTLNLLWLSHGVKMVCDECHETKDKQKYDDTCDSCVMKIMGKMWREEIKPNIEGFIKQVKEMNDG